MTCEECGCNKCNFCDKYGLLIADSSKEYDCWESECQSTEENNLKILLGRLLKKFLVYQ